MARLTVPVAPTVSHVGFTGDLSCRSDMFQPTNVGWKMPRWWMEYACLHSFLHSVAPCDFVCVRVTVALGSRFRGALNVAASSVFIRADSSGRLQHHSGARVCCRNSPLGTSDPPHSITRPRSAFRIHCAWYENIVPVSWPLIRVVPRVGQGVQRGHQKPAA